MQGVWQDELIKGKDIREFNIEVNVRNGLPIPAPHIPIFLYNHYAVTHQVEDILDPAIWGRYYNWYAATNTLLPPAGWHLPTVQEIIDLGYIIGDHSYAGGRLKSTSSAFWNAPNTGATNQYGFSAIGSGDKAFDTGMTQDLKNVFQGWLSDVYSDEYGSIWNMASDAAYLSPSPHGRSGQFKTHGCAVRFIKNDSNNTGYAYDIDGNQYTQITIGSQVWMGQNYRCTRFNNGNPIPYVQAPAAWSAIGANPAQAIPAGLKNGFNPDGWHVSTNADWDTLAAYAGYPAAYKMINPALWPEYDDTQNCTNEYLLYIGKGNYRTISGDFYLNYESYFWNAEVRPAMPDWALAYQFYGCCGDLYDSFAYRKEGWPIRLVKNDSNNPGTVTFEDQIYPTTQIGSQVWVAQNIRLTRYNDGSIISLVPDNTEWSNLTTGARCYVPE